MSLQYLDVLIGFATVMLGVSLVITILTQLISGLLGLRGSNLRWGIRTLLEQVDSNLAANSKPLTQAILDHQLISDSTFSKFDSFRPYKRLRLATAISRKELTNILEILKEDVVWKDLLGPHIPKINTSIENWFDSTMDRVSQRFAMTMRYWTVGFGIVLAFLLHLDSIALLKQLSRDQSLRAKLVASADAVLHQSENVLGASGGTNVFRLALDQLRTRTNTLEVTKGLTNPPPLLNQESAYLWLSKQLSTNSQRDKLMETYRELVSSNVVAHAPELMGTIGLVRDELQRAGLDLVPKRIYWEDCVPTRLSFWGMLVTAGLLSLGAPFWYNGLKTLLSLRPALAAREKPKAAGTGQPNPPGGTSQN